MAMPPPPPPTPPASSAPTLPRCYRHPDREAGRSCTRCGKSACSDCLVQAAVGSHCLDCAKASRPDLGTRAKYWNARQHTLVTYVLMAVNIAVFVYVSVADPGSLGGRGGVSRTQFELGLNEFFLTNGRSEWYRLVTSGFLHFGVIHIGFNMFLLYQLGQLLERPLGRTKFALLYAASLLGGSFGVLIMQSSGITGGASGAVFGLMAAAAIGLHRQGINVMSTGIGTTLLLNFFLTFAIPGISIGGHLGGAAAGAICGFVMLAPRWRPVPDWVKWATPIAVLVISVLGSVLVVQ
ncbi:MAG: rhomboid family intramembrane serine protease [Acidimicrobiales bacterium]|nr:rhomboid family intramembrane serine protease [Acidimicrobiales bacterium]MCB9394754.1 rhomboid family intramembrane serine protease [Acidimicrobiaceae bacterium]